MAEIEEIYAEHDNDDGAPENSQHEETQEHVDAQVIKGGENRWPGWPGETVFRLLVPAQKVGSIIGRKGEFIKKMCEETRARIKILDGPPGTAERAVLVSAKEEPDASLPPAVDGLLRVHKRTLDGLDGESLHVPLGMGEKVSTRLLVPATQAGSLIGKQGATVKSIQESSACIVRVLEDLPIFALEDDRIVEVVGKPVGIHKAVELIASHLRKLLVDRSIISLFEVQHLHRCKRRSLRWNNNCRLLNPGFHRHKLFLQMLLWDLVMELVLVLCRHHHSKLIVTIQQQRCHKSKNNLTRKYQHMEEKPLWPYMQRPQRRHLLLLSLRSHSKCRFHYLMLML